jgi:hypothetical protein
MKKIKLPNGWNEVTVNQFIDIKNIEVETSNILFNINLLSILTNTLVDDKMWSDLYITELGDLMKNIQWCKTVPSINYKKEINGLKFKDFYTLTLGEYIDIDTFISENCIDNLPKICAILYRNYKYDEYDNLILEPYTNIDIAKRSVLFNDISINDIYGIILDFNRFKEHIIKSFGGIFNPNLDDEDLDDEDLDDIAVQKEIEKEKLQTKWSWEFILYQLSNGDITKYDEILSLPFIFILNQLSFKKSFNL